MIDPPTGWVVNTNNAPWTAAGASSPKQDAYPAYVDRFPENARGRHALEILAAPTWTLESLAKAIYDPHLPAFALMVPPLVRAFDAAPDPKLGEAIDILRIWDHRSRPTPSRRRSRSTGPKSSIAGSPRTSARSISTSRRAWLRRISSRRKLEADHGTWKIKWGGIYRFQCLSGDVTAGFDDTRPSIPIGFTAGRWGSLASFSAPLPTTTKKRYATTGEFGARVRAKAVLIGGSSSDPKSPHFTDQAARATTGDLRDVYFYPEDIAAHAARRYRPGN